ncbi:MAG: alpha/beta hydrolase [bacterium]|nr:alpha/beta hydrolase [bacterium]
MIFKEFGNRDNPVIILLHGGGLSSWSVEPIAEILKDRFCIITPIIDGHGEDGENQFVSIRKSAENIIKYVDEFFSGIVYSLCGLSLGAQIVIDVLTLRENICKYSIIESALTIPMKFTKTFLLPMISLSYPLIKQKWYSNIQAKFLLLPKNMHELYYIDSCKISKKSLKNIILSNSSFYINNNICKSKSKVLILVGGKEIGVMKKSAVLLSKIIPQSSTISLSNYGHGELSQLHPEEYSKVLLDFMK